MVVDELGHQLSLIEETIIGIHIRGNQKSRKWKTDRQYSGQIKRTTISKALHIELKTE